MPYSPSTKNYRLHAMIVSDLLNYGCNLNLKDSDGNTPLHTYILYHKIHVKLPILEKLLEKHQEIDFSIRNNDGHTFLELAIKFCNDSVIRTIGLKGCPKYNITHSMYPLLR